MSADGREDQQVGHFRGANTTGSDALRPARPCRDRACALEVCAHILKRKRGRHVRPQVACIRLRGGVPCPDGRLGRLRVRPRGVERADIGDAHDDTALGGPRRKFSRQPVGDTAPPPGGGPGGLQGHLDHLRLERRGLLPGHCPWPRHAPAAYPRPWPDLGQAGRSQCAPGTSGLRRFLAPSGAPASPHLRTASSSATVSGRPPMAGHGGPWRPDRADRYSPW